MSTVTVADFDNTAAWQEYQAAERRIREEYVTAVKAARRAYERETAPARDAYDHAERTAWMTYYHAGRWAWRTYQARLDMDPAAGTSPVPVAGVFAEDTGSTCGCEIPQPRPTFTTRPPAVPPGRVNDVHPRQPAFTPHPDGAVCGARPYPVGSEGDDGTMCMLPPGHAGHHDDNPAATPATDPETEQ